MKFWLRCSRIGNLFSLPTPHPTGPLHPALTMQKRQTQGSWMPRLRSASLTSRAIGGEGLKSLSPNFLTSNTTKKLTVRIK